MPQCSSPDRRWTDWANACLRLLMLIALVGMWSGRAPAAQAQTGEPADGDVAPLATVSKHLAQSFAASDGPVDFLVILKTQPDAEALLATPDLQAASRELRARTLYEQMTQQAAASQATLRSWLDEQGIDYRPFWIVNAIQVRGTALQAATLRRFPEVDRLVDNPPVQQSLLATEPALSPASVPALTAAAGKTVDNAEDKLAQQRITQQAVELPYGLVYTHAPDVWALGYRGQGIVVASQDTGVDWNHPALRNAYRGWTPGDASRGASNTGANTTESNTTESNTTESNSVVDPGAVDHVYNWFDAWDAQGRPARCATNAQIPCDDNGHGTHTVGTMVGVLPALEIEVGALGMAPDAKWVACRNMLNNVGTPASYAACFEFFLAPYPSGGDPFVDGRPELAPNIINNSWACPPSEGCDADSLRQVVETVRAAGIFVASSAGNSGAAGCGSVNTPIAIHDAAFSVGAHNEEGTIAGFSSRGPVIVDGSNRLKPDLSAPGVRVYSAYVRDPAASPATPQHEGFATLSGTSMASPHVAGAVALLWSAEPTLVGDVDRTEQLLLKSASPAAPDAADNPDNNCTAPGTDGTIPVPNNTYGFGRLDVLAAVELAQDPATVSVRVQSSDGAPLADETATLTDQLTAYELSAQTDTAGTALFDVVYAGDYRVGIASTPDMPLTLVNVQKGATLEAVVVLEQAAKPAGPLYLPLVLR